MNSQGPHTKDGGEGGGGLWQPLPHFYAKQNLFYRNDALYFVYIFQEHQKYVFKSARKAEMQVFPLRQAPTFKIN